MRKIIPACLLAGATAAAMLAVTWVGTSARHGAGGTRGEVRGSPAGYQDMGSQEGESVAAGDLVLYPAQEPENTQPPEGGPALLSPAGAEGATADSAIPALSLPALELHPLVVDAPISQPTSMAFAPDGSGRLFVTELAGRVSVLAERDGVLEAGTFLDLSDQVSRDGWEDGLLGLAFHPRFVENGQFYVTFSAGYPLRLVLARFTASRETPEAADPQSGVAILEIPKLRPNHNGGQIGFGPDGYLYMSVGDGDDDGNPAGTAQAKDTLLGKILRIDVDASSSWGGYGIPPDNPYANDPNARPEIWAYGFRNPWRWSFDELTQRLWVADVGELGWEEINIVEPGGNYGWNTAEGVHCYPEGPCDMVGMEPPTFAYSHEAGDCAVIGGIPYRGEAIRGLWGWYVFGDFCTGRVWALRRFGQEVSVHELVSTDRRITSFAVDSSGTIYMLDYEGGITRFGAIEPF